MKKPLHPLTLWICAILLAIGVVALDNAFIALAIVGAVALLVYIRRDGSPWQRSFLFSIRVGAVILAIRTVVGILFGVPIPGTKLFTLPILDLPSWMPGIRVGGVVTLERLSSSLHEGVIIATMIALFGAATSLTSPHKLLRVTPTFIYEIGITLVIATSLFPQLATSARRIRTAQKLRGMEKIHIRSIAIPLLEESLSRSLQLAAAMDARGYGMSSKRSRYRPQPWLMRDNFILILTGLATIVMVAQ
ncbi:CbiQ ABC-type cobalt transport system, permease component CbiQ and related transporters [Candidatus Nanopelagicaceae bacterium]